MRLEIGDIKWFFSSRVCEIGGVAYRDGGIRQYNPMKIFVRKEEFKAASKFHFQ